MGEGHLPVLVDEVLASLDVAPGSSIADCTVGGGGHAERLLEASSPDGRLLGLDADRAAIAEAQRVLAQYADRVVLRQANFAEIYDVANEAGFVPLDAILFDLGLSSYQLADSQRGFSFAADAPPDMRFDEAGGLSALELIDRSTQRELAGILATFGEERRAGRIAKAILAARAAGRLMTAADLAAVRPGGRLAVISYHSGEDRIVKRFMARESRDCVEDPPPPICTCGHRAQLRVLARRGITPGPDEVRRNRRARSARLRVAEKLAPAGGSSPERRVNA
jgi:16S rRNA (cytosine1402-N4)-methyltransferase